MLDMQQKIKIFKALGNETRFFIFKTVFYLFFMYSSLFSQEISSSYKLGSFDGMFRAYHVFSPSYVKSGRSEDYAVNGSTIGGHIRYHTPKQYDIGITTALYYSMGTGLNDTKDPNTIMATGRFFTKDYSPKAVLGELNVHYKDDFQSLVVGHFKINSPLTNAIVTYMPNMFEALVYENRLLNNTTISVGKIEKMAYGTRSSVEYGMIGEATNTAGATQSGIDIKGKFRDIGSQTLVDNTKNTDGVYLLGLENDALKNIKLRTWNFYATDILNMFYLDASYKNSSTPYGFSAQYLRIDSVGENLGSSLLDSSSAYLVGLKASIQNEKSNLYLAYNHSGDGKILNPWGGDPAFTSSVFSRNAYRANVNAYKIGFDYKMTDDFTIKNSYAYYGKSTTEGTFVPSQPAESISMPDTNAMEYDMIFLYNITKKLHFLGLLSYKTSEYYYADKTVEFLDVDMVLTYSF